MFYGFLFRRYHNKRGLSNILNRLHFGKDSMFMENINGQIVGSLLGFTFPYLAAHQLKFNDIKK